MALTGARGPAEVGRWFPGLACYGWAMLRARMLVGLCFAGLLGVAVMPGDVEGQEKDAERFPEKATLRAWDKSGKAFQKPYDNLPVKKVEDKNGVRFVAKAIAVNAGQPTVKSEITHGEDTWIVDKVERGTTSHTCHVTKKP